MAEETTEGASVSKLRLIQAGRIFVGLAIPALVIGHAYIWHTVFENYAERSRELWQPPSFWGSSGVEITVSVAAGLVVAFWNFRSKPIGKAIVVTAAVTGLLIVLWVWTALNG